VTNLLVNHVWQMIKIAVVFQKNLILQLNTFKPLL